MGMTREQITRALRRHRRLLRHQREGRLHLPARCAPTPPAWRARLRFSIAAAKDHDVLLIDEALATGDRSFQKRSEARIRELRKHAGTVFLVSHSNKSIRDTCDRVLWLERGELRMDGPTEEVLRGVRGLHRRPGQGRSTEGRGPDPRPGPRFRATATSGARNLDGSGRRSVPCLTAAAQLMGAPQQRAASSASPPTGSPGRTSSEPWISSSVVRARPRIAAFFSSHALKRCSGVEVPLPDGQHVRGERRVRRVQVLADGGAGHGLPAVGPRQLDDAVHAAG